MTSSRSRTLLALLCLLAAPARAQVVPDGIHVEPLATALSAPTGFDFLPDGRVIYVEQFTAMVRVLTVGMGVQATPVLTVAARSARRGRLVRQLGVSGSEEGTRTLVWDGRDEHGVSSAPGVYVAFLDVGSRGIARRVVLLR